MHLIQKIRGIFHMLAFIAARKLSAIEHAKKLAEDRKS